MTFDNNNSLKPTRKEEGVTQAGLFEKKVKDIEEQIDDIKERLTPLENTVEGFENEVNTESVIADQVHSGHDYTDALSVSGDADVQGTVSAAKVTAADVEVSIKVKTKDVQVTNDLTVEGTGTFAQLSAENFDIETFNADELNVTELSSDNADITNLASDSITADEANITSINSNEVTSGNVEAREKIIAQDAELSGTLEADIAYLKNLRVSRKLNALELIAETMQSGRLFIAPEQMFLIPENGWIHFHNVNAGRFILYLTDFTDTTTNIHSLGNVKFSAVIDYVNNSEKGAVKVLYVQPELKSFEAVYVADNGEIWFKRSSQYLNARRAVVFAESEKELIVDTFAENAQTFNVSEAKSITLRNFNNDDEIVKEKFFKGDYTIDGNVRITGFLTPGQVISERALFLGYSDYVTADSDGILSAKGAVIDGNLSVVNDATINGDNTVAGDETIGGTLSVTGNTDLDADLNVDGETTLNDDVTVTGDVSITGTLGVTGDVTLGEDLSVSGNTVLHETEINGELKVDADINAAASVHVDKDVSIKGDLYVQGVTYQTEETNVSTTGDYIVTRDNNNTPLGNGEYSGLAVNNYDTGKIATLTADSNGEWRVSDSATVTAQTYTNVSEFNGGWYSGITQTVVTALKGIFINISGDELTDVVLYNGSDYYHFDGVTWYGTISVSNGKLVKGNAVTDAALITALEGLTKHTLVYYASVTVKEIDASTNQPLLTRDEAVNLTNDDVLIWDDTGKKAVGSNAFQKKNLANAVEGATTVEGALSALSTNKQPRTLDTPITVSGVSKTTVEDALSAMNGIIAQKYARRFNSTHNRYVELGTMPYSSSDSNLSAVLDIFAFYDGYIGEIHVDIQSRSNALRVKGWTNIDLSTSAMGTPRFIVSNENDEKYHIYIDCNYMYLYLSMYVEHVAANFTVSNFPASASITGTEVFNSTTNEDIQYLDGTGNFSYLSPDGKFELNLRRINKIVAFEFYLNNATLTYSSDGVIVVPANTIPTSFWPKNIQSFTLLGRDNGAWNSANYYNCLFRVASSDGTVKLMGKSSLITPIKYAAITGTYFTN